MDKVSGGLIIDAIWSWKVSNFVFIMVNFSLIEATLTKIPETSAFETREREPNLQTIASG